MSIIFSLLVQGFAVVATAYILPGVTVTSFLSAVVAGFVLSVVNRLIKPVLLLVTLPINFLTLGLFTFVINGLLVLLVSGLVPGFQVDGFLTAILFSIVISIVGWGLNSLKR
jgi:putative membrane protein